MTKGFTFLDADNLNDKEICLTVGSLNPEDREKGLVPSYAFNIVSVKTGETLGYISLRIGNSEKLYYGGNIGYRVIPEHQGHRYAAKACALVFNQARRHGMKELIITCNPDNIASRRTCELAGGKLLEIAELPETNDMFQDGERYKCIYRFEL